MTDEFLSAQSKWDESSYPGDCLKALILISVVTVTLNDATNYRDAFALELAVWVPLQMTHQLCSISKA